MRRKLLVVVLFILLGACRRKHTIAEDVRLANKVAAREVTLYYENADFLLGPERRTLSLPENDAAALPVVTRELIKGSANAAVPRLFPPDTVVRGAYLLPDGTAIVDIGGNTLAAGWSTGSHAEIMAVYSVVTTLTADFASVKRVRFLVNGQVAETLAGHIAIDRALHPSAAFVTRADTPRVAAK